MTGPSNVQLHLPCPTCHEETVWNGVRTEPNHGTAYKIGCDCTDQPAEPPEQLPASPAVASLQALQRYWRRGAA